MDQPTTFDVKEPLLADEPLTVASRTAVPYDFASDGGDGWATALLESGFDPSVPTVWLLEGLLYYLSEADNETVMRLIGSLSAPQSAVFHDAVTAHYPSNNIRPGGAPFISGSDDYASLWAKHAGFGRSGLGAPAATTTHRRLPPPYASTTSPAARPLPLPPLLTAPPPPTCPRTPSRPSPTRHADSTVVRNFNLGVRVDRRGRRLIVDGGRGAEATPAVCRGKDVVLFVESVKE